jgi:hypothetical protein
LSTPPIGSRYRYTYILYVVVYLIVRDSMGLDCKAIGYLFPGNIPIGSQVYAYRGNIRGRGIYPVGGKRGYP